MEEIAPNSCSKPMMERRVRPQKDQALNCPRCSSTNTKFCYYNNYSLTQPRYFCKTCRRYWTEGGSLRNIPVGGGSRKNRRSTTTTSAAAAASSHKLPDLNPPNLAQFSSQNTKIHEGQDLNLGFPSSQEYHGVTQFVKLPKIEANNTNHHNSSFSSPTLLPLSALELLRTGIASRGLNSFVSAPMPPDSNTLYTPLFPLQEFKPTLSFSVDELGSRYGILHGVQENGSTGRLSFPFGAVKDQFSRASDVDNENKEQGNSTGCWNGMVGGGSW